MLKNTYHQTATLNVAVIGGGPRGLAILEALRQELHARGRGAHVHIHLIEPNEVGPGVHVTGQPEFRLLHSVAGLPTAFLPVGSTGLAQGPSLLAWVNSEAGGQCVGTARGDWTTADFLPRAWLGKYLRWSYEFMSAHLPPGLGVTHWREQATDVALRDGVEEVRLNDGQTLKCHAVVLCVGHVPIMPDGDARYVRATTYDALEDIGAHERVAISGFGLTAMDVLASLTQGRGGRFAQINGGLEYVASGAEPRITMYSRTGLPYRARPLGDTGNFNHAASTELENALSRLLAQSRDECGELQVRRDLWPLVVKELARVLRKAEGSTEEIGPEDIRRVGELLDGSSRLDSSSSETSEASFFSLIEEDLNEARHGFGSPTKVVMETLLHLRPYLRKALDFRRADVDGTNWFYDVVVPLINRNSVGPQFERMEELIALRRAGIVNVPFGSCPTLRRDSSGWSISSTCLKRMYECRVDRVIAAAHPTPNLHDIGSPLLRHLHAAGRLVPNLQLRSGSGIEVTPRFNPRGADGQVQASLFVLGPLCEGSRYYNHYLPTVQVGSDPLSDAREVVCSILAAHQD